MKDIKLFGWPISYWIIGIGISVVAGVFIGTSISIAEMGVTNTCDLHDTNVSATVLSKWEPVGLKNPYMYYVLSNYSFYKTVQPDVKVGTRVEIYKDCSDTVHLEY